jgi:hypothetical protein
MGMSFPLRYTNLVAYFTTDVPSVESTLRDLRGFFEMLQMDEWRLVTSARDDAWPRRIRELAAAAAAIVKQHAPAPEAIFTPALQEARRRAAAEEKQVPIDEPLVPIDDVFANNRDVLQRLHLAFRESHDVFVLGVAGGWNDVQTVNAFLHDTLLHGRARVSMLFLLPDDPFDSPLDFTSPFPGAAAICRYPERWPGVLVWNRFGNVLFLPLQTAPRALRTPGFLAQFASSLTAESMNRLERGYVPPVATGRQIRILHLSDLHFGTKYAARNQDYLLAVLKDEFRSRFDHVVITGDLFDSIWKRKWRAFESFRQALRLITDHDPIVIPGNHDCRIMGNRLWRFGESYRYVAELDVRPLHEDRQLQCLFFCFNSAKSGHAAQGEVLEEDLVRFATEYHILASRNPDVKNWLRVGLVHHHPFKFEAASEGMTAKLLNAFGIPESKLLDMKQGDRFVRWCADRGIQLILHGHRHVQRKISQAVPVQGPNGVTAVQVTAVGCGTSLGAEGIPKSFNLISWDPESQRWSSSFFLDRSGSGFKEIRATSTVMDPMVREV